MLSEENKLIKNCQSGQLECFTEIYRYYFDAIYRFIYYRTLHRETAEDLTSQTFFKALDNIGKYHANKGSFSSWIYQIARNSVIDHYRTHKTETDIDTVFDLHTDDDIEKDLTNKQRVEQVTSLLNRLKPEQKEIVVMRLWDQLSYKEISEITGRSIAGCKMTFSRTVLKLRDELTLLIAYIIIITTKL